MWTLLGRPTILSSQTIVALDAAALGMSGDYQVDRIDLHARNLTRQGTSTDQLSTSNLLPWGLESFKLTRGKR
jgi:hypothetical protein